MRKALLFFVFGLFIAQLGFAQYHKEEMMGPGPYDRDPVKVQVFPNPAIEYVNIKFEAPVAKKSRIVLHNIIGNPLEFESEILDDFEIKIRVKELPTGYYFLSVQDDTEHTKGTYKFLKR